MRTIKLLAINLLVLVLLLAALEWVLEKVNPETRHHSLMARFVRLREIALPNTVFTETPHPIFQQYTENLTLKEYRVEVDSQGFIRSETTLPEARLNIVFLGGSTTECRYVDDSLRFPSLVGKRLQAEGLSVNTFNAGVAGNHSLHSLNILTNKILHRNFQVVVLMHAINDLVHLSYNGSYTSDDLTPTRRNLFTLCNPDFDEPDLYFFREKNTAQRLVKSFQVLFPRLHYEWLSIRMKVTSPQQPLEFGWEKLQPVGEAQFDEFRHNLRSFVALCRANDILPVLMTQFNRVLENEFADNPVFHPYTVKLNASATSVDAFCDSYRKMNDIVREVALDEQVLLIDLEQEVPGTKDYLYDMVHLHNAGSIKVAGSIVEYLKPALLTKEAEKSTPLKKNFEGLRKGPLQ